MSTPVNSITSSSSTRSSSSNHTNQQAQRRSRSRTRSKDGTNLIPANLTLTTNDHPGYPCQQHNAFNNPGIGPDGQPISDLMKNEQQAGMDISKRVVNRVESLRQFLLHGKLNHNQQEQNAAANNASVSHGDGLHETSNGMPHLNNHGGQQNPGAALNHNHSQCSCRPHGNVGMPAQGFVAHRQAAFLAASNVASCNQFRPGLAHTRRRSKSSERLGGGPPRLSIATSPAYMATALPNGAHHPQMFAPPFLFATFNPQEVVR